MTPAAPYRFTLFLKIILFFFLLLSLSIGLTLWLVPYDELLEFVTRYFHLQERQQLLEETLSRQKLLIVKGAFVLLTLMFAWLFFLSAKVAALIHPIFLDFGRSFSHHVQITTKLWKTLPLSAKVTALSLFSVLILYRLACVFYFPFLNDEVYSYLFLVDRGLPVIVSNYHGPNSHILYLLIANFFDIFLNPQAAMRLPVFIAGIIVPVLIFFILLARYNALIAFLTTVVFSFSFHITFYSSIGRGHIFFIFFLILAIWSAIRIAEGGGRVSWIAFGAATVCGAYTLLTWIYPLAALIVFVFIYLKKERQSFQPFVLTLGFSFLLLLLLFLPVLVISGLETITDNWWVRSVTYPHAEFFQRLPAYLAKVGGYLWETQDSAGAVLSLATFGAGAFILYLRKEYKILLMLLLLLLMPFFILLVQGLLPLEKTWLYFLLLKSFCLALLLDETVKFFSQALVKRILVVTAFALAFILAAIKMSQQDFGFYHRLEEFLVNVPEYEGQKILATEDTYYLYLRYYFEIEKNIYPTLHLRPQQGVNYDMLVLPASAPTPDDDYSQFYRNREVKAFFKAPNGN